MKVDKDKLLEWLTTQRDFYEGSPLTHESGRHWMLNITISRVNSGIFDVEELDYDRYEIDKELTKENYSIFDTSEERYLGLNLKKSDAVMIALALNKSK